MQDDYICDEHKRLQGHAATLWFLGYSESFKGIASCLYFNITNLKIELLSKRVFHISH